MEKFSIVIPMLSVKHHGGTRIILQLTKYFVEKGHKVTILVPKDKYAPIYPVDKRIKIKLTSKVGNNDIFYLKTLIEFIFKIPKSDFILANFFPTFYPSLLTRLLKKGKMIYFPQGIGGTHPSFKMPFSQILRLAEILSFKFSVPIIVTSEWQKNIVLKLNKNANLKKIPLGLLGDVFYSDYQVDIANHDKRVLYFPRKETNKGLEDFLKALEILIGKGYRFTLWLVTKEKEILSEFDYLKNKLKIKIFSPANDEELKKIYSSVYLLVSSSWIEGFCLPVLEAMACGTPAVITDSGGPREYAVHDYNCLIVPSKRPNLLAQAVQKLLLDEKLREKLMANSLETAKKFKFSKFAEEFERFLLSFK